jgi:hypothetical protein
VAFNQIGGASDPHILHELLPSVTSHLQENQVKFVDSVASALITEAESTKGWNSANPSRDYGAGTCGDGFQPFFFFKKNTGFDHVEILFEENICRTNPLLGCLETQSKC